MLISRKQTTPETNTPNGDERETINTFSDFNEKTIVVLNILEKNGIDIYSESNYGGMFLKTKESRFQQIFSGSKQKQEPKNEIDNNHQSLKDFFKNGRN